MSILKIIATSVVNAYDTVLASWDDIELASPTTSGTNPDVALDWDLGGTRSIRLNYIGVGDLYYRVESGSYVLITGGPAGTSYTHTAGETLGFKYDNTVNINETRTISVVDATAGRTINTFQVVYSGGDDGGIGGGGGGGGIGGDNGWGGEGEDAGEENPN